MNWISVKDRLPEFMEEVLLRVNYYDSFIHIQGYCYNEFMNIENPSLEDVFFEYRVPDVEVNAGEAIIIIKQTLFKLSSDEVTHWMPLPEPPKK